MVEHNPFPKQKILLQKHIDISLRKRLENKPIACFITEYSFRPPYCRNKTFVDKI